MDKRQTSITVLICLLIAIAVVFAGAQTKSKEANNLSTPPPVPVAHASFVTSVISPDGKFALAMKAIKGEQSTDYKFTLTDEATKVQKEILTKSETGGAKLSIPDNTFSSDNKYVFLKETDGEKVGYLALSVEPKPDMAPMNVSDLFNSKYKNLTITEATGWAGPTLLIINTNKIDGSLGPSFWFDTASRSFIQLSNRFN